MDRLSACNPLSKANKNEVRVMCDEVMSVRIREAQAVAELKDIKQRVMEQETQVRASCWHFSNFCFFVRLNSFSLSLSFYLYLYQGYQAESYGAGDTGKGGWGYAFVTQGVFLGYSLVLCWSRSCMYENTQSDINLINITICLSFSLAHLSRHDP